MRAVLGALSLTDRIFLAYLAVLTGIVIVFWQAIPYFGLFLADQVLAGGLILGLVWAHGRFGGRFWRLLRSWYPLPLVMIAFRELHYLVPAVHPHDADGALQAIDRLVFGVDPTVWLERIMHPALTEFLQVVYSSYFFIPMLVAVCYYVRRSELAFEECLGAIVLGFLVSYLGYFLVPALGPRYTMTHLQTVPLQGYDLYQILRVGLDDLELEQRDCFPSGHTMISLIALVYAWRFNSRLFWGLLPLVSSLIFSTVYLRYHFVVDVAAGALIAWGVTFGTPYVILALRGRIPVKTAVVRADRAPARHST